MEKSGVKVVIGPIFYESLEKLNTIDNLTFIALTNKISKIPKNIIAFGININSQIDALEKYFKKNEISKTVLLSPKNQFIEQTKAINDSKLEYYKASNFDTDPKKITQEIEKFSKLPIKAQIYINFIEKFVDAKVSTISTSPERKDTILIEDPFNT